MFFFLGYGTFCFSRTLFIPLMCAYSLIQQVERLRRQLAELREKSEHLKVSAKNASPQLSQSSPDKARSALSPQKSMDLANNFILGQVEVIWRWELVLSAFFLLLQFWFHSGGHLWPTNWQVFFSIRPFLGFVWVKTALRI